VTEACIKQVLRLSEAILYFEFSGKSIDICLRVVRYKEFDFPLQNRAFYIQMGRDKAANHWLWWVVGNMMIDRVSEPSTLPPRQRVRRENFGG